MKQKKKNLHRVLYIENGIGYGGAVICLRHLIRNLNPDRFRPFVVTTRSGQEYEGIAQEAGWFHFSDRIVDLKNVKRSIENSSFLNSHKIIKAVLNQGIARFDDLVNFIPFLIWLLTVVFRVRPSLIHANNEPLCNRAGILLGKIFRIPVICHFRGNIEGSRMMQWCFRLPDHFIPVSHWVSREITALGVSLKKQTVVYDGIALEKLDLKADPSEFRGRFGIPENAFAVGLIGLLIPWKGQNLFIDAAKGLSRKIPNLKMMIVGGTPDEFRNYEKELRNRVVREGLRDVVVFTGHLSSMSHVYMGMDVVVSASISPEPLGTMVIECMAMGCPLIVPSHGGGAEMNRDGETALIFQAGNAESLESTILKLYREPETGKRLGQNAREKALRTFDIATHARCVQTIYDKVLDIRK